MNKSGVINILYEIAELLELIGENPFKLRAYLNAARVLEGQSDEIEDIVRSGRLGELPGFGETLTQKITTLVTTGELPYYEELKKQVPAGLLDLVRIPGLGPKRARILYSRLKIDSLEKLKAACEEHRIVALEGFGEKSEKNILSGLEHFQKYSERHRYDEAYPTGRKILEKIKKHPGVIRCELGGSLRRHRETIGDIDIVASAKDPPAVIDYFATLSEVSIILGQGETKGSVRLKETGVQADLRVVTDEEFPAALHYFTGNKEHNTKMRARAKDFGMKLNEYGLFKGKRRVPCKTEEDVFKALGLSYIPPELREDWGEIEAAEKNRIPDLVEEKDIRGLFHVHSDWSDGVASLEAMITEAERLGLDYVGISDHSQSAHYAGGLTPQRIKDQEKEIERLRRRFKIQIFWGIESDILSDGSLDYAKDILERFDFVIASVHSGFKMSEEQMTSRIVTALKNQYTSMLGHATGRLILSREPYAIDMRKVIDAASEYGKVIELNASPHRFDLDWRLGPYVKKKKVKVAINPDAHSISGLSDYRYGVGIARKGWLTREDVVTTLPADKIGKFLKA